MKETITYCDVCKSVTSIDPYRRPKSKSERMVGTIVIKKAIKELDSESAFRWYETTIDDFCEVCEKRIFDVIDNIS